MRPADTAFSHHCPRRGFNLVEAAIVLGVVGLVIGGIWVAASAVRQNFRLNELATSLIAVVDGARKLMPISAYPTGAGQSLMLTGTLSAAGILPQSWSLLANHWADSPAGILARFELGCTGVWGLCPVLIVRIEGTSITSAECTQLVRRVVALTKASTAINTIQIGNMSPIDSNYIVLQPPYNTSFGAGGGASGSDIVCPSRIYQLNFSFNP